MSNPTQHRIWRYGDNVNTDVIFPGKYTYTITERADMAQYALQDLDPAFATNAKPGDIIVAGRNWGSGSSREQAVICLIELGIRAVIAKSFARIYYRNAINSGLLVIACPEIVDHLSTGDSLTLDTANSHLSCTAGTFTYPPLPASVQGIVTAGGLIPYLKHQHQSDS